MTITAKIINFFSRKDSINSEAFFNSGQIKEGYQLGYKCISNVKNLYELKSIEQVRETLSPYLRTDVKIVSIEYGFINLPPYEISGYYPNSSWTIPERTIENTWKIDIEKNGKKISLVAIYDDLAVFYGNDIYQFTPYRKGYQFSRKDKCSYVKNKRTGGYWNEAEVIMAIPHFEYDGRQINFIGITEKRGLSYHGNSGCSFKETSSRYITKYNYDAQHQTFITETDVAMVNFLKDFAVTK